MYPKYTTECFIVSARQSGENDRVFRLYTKEFGMIRASAKSVRLGRSKLKAHLRDGNLLKVSLVRGRELWRLIDCFEEIPDLDSLRQKKVFARLLKLLGQLVHGEEKNAELFSGLANIRGFIRSEDPWGEDLKSVECFGVMAILSALGYGRDTDDWTEFLKELSAETIQKISQKRPLLVRLINDALSQSHLYQKDSAK